MTDLTPRVPPHSNGAEVSLIGSVLLDNDALSSASVNQVTPESFYRAGHRHIWACIPTLREKRGEDGTPGPVDLVTVHEELTRRGQLDDVGGAAYLMGLSNDVPTAAYAEHYARIVLEKADLRAKIAFAGHLMRTCYDQQLALEDIDALAATAPRLELPSDTLIRAGDALQNVLDQAAQGNSARGAPTGLLDLDDFMGGYEGTPCTCWLPDLQWARPPPRSSTPPTSPTPRAACWP